MKYVIENDRIIIYSKDEFCPKHILECGQIFSYKNDGKNYIVYSNEYMAKIIENNDNIEIITPNTDYFVNFFDLSTDYNEIKNKLLNKYPYLKNAINFGSGIRILKQDIFETIIGFIVSANNNIKRIQKILFAIREKYGKNMGEYFAFPTLHQLKNATEEDFKNLGAGYRAKYLYEVVRQLEKVDINNLTKLSTKQLNDFLLTLMGVGQKVADCILLFAFARCDVFPVDTWIEKVYCTYFNEEHDRKKIRESLLKTFGNDAGYAQQYLFYSQRELN